MNRIHNLDYLRGIAALGIIIFHYLSWTIGEFESNTILGRIGIYGVSVFYILSGLTLYHVYNTNLDLKFHQLTKFYKKRFLRIFPLLWLVCIFTILLFNNIPNWVDIVLNFTGLFGFFKWSTYIATGTWSIGNELVFYLFFPFYLWLLNYKKVIAIFVTIIVFLIYIYFAFILLNKNLMLTQNWHDYVNPLNQLFLFTSGMLIGVFFANYKSKNLVYLLILSLGILLFTLFPAEGNPINIVTGINRLVFTLASILICLGFYKFEWELPQLIQFPLKKLGNISYSVYLLHPLLYALVGFGNNHLKQDGFGFNETIRLLLSFFSTIIVSHLVYTYFEKYFMRFGKSSFINKLHNH
jgi:exopolysaccharide production protein ExoZ